MEEGDNNMRGKKIMVVTLCVLLLFGTLSLASVSLGHQKALADEATFYSTASDGYLSKGDPTYNNAHIAPNAGYIANAITYIRVGQQLLTDYYIYRDEHLRGRRQEVTGKRSHIVYCTTGKL